LTDFRGLRSVEAMSAVLCQRRWRAGSKGPVLPAVSAFAAAGSLPVVAGAALGLALALALALVLASTVCGCSPRTDAELLQIDSVEVKAFDGTYVDSDDNGGGSGSGIGSGRGSGRGSERGRENGSEESAGARLELVGGGFPSGRECEVWLQGEVHRGGAGSGEVSLKLKARALSNDLVKAVMDRKALAALYGTGVSGSFQGRLRVVFESADRTTLVFGELAGVRLDLPDLSDRGLKERRLHAKRARRFLGFAGLKLDESALSSEGEGMAISAVRAGSPAWAAGLRGGDVILRASGIRARSLRDLEPEPNAKQVVLSVVRGARQGSMEMRVSTRGFEASRLNESSLQIAALLCLLTLVVIFYSPLAGFTLHMLEPPHGGGGAGAAEAEGKARYPAERRSERRGLWAVWNSSPGPGLPARRRRPALAGIEAGLRLLVAPLAASALLLAMVFCQPLCGAEFDSLLVCLALVGFGSSAALLVGRGASFGQRARAAAGNLVSVILACVPVGYACALGATRSLDAIVAAQGGAPWQWLVMKNPGLALGFPLFLTGCAGGYPFGFSRARQGHGWSRLYEVAGGAVMCGVGAAVFLGGWQTAGLPYLESVDLALAGPALFLGKAWLLAFLVQMAHERRMAERLGLRTALFLILVSAMVVAAWIALSVSAEAEAVAGYALFGVALVVGATALMLRRSARLRPCASALVAGADLFR
jgi:hypothetical protein